MHSPVARLHARACLLAVTLALASMPPLHAASPPPLAAAWKPIPLLPSSEIVYTPAIFDPPRHRIILFPEDLGIEGACDLWMIDTRAPAQWVPTPVLGTPPPFRRGRAAIYDPVRDRVVLWGGWSIHGVDPSVDVWFLNLAGTPTWSHAIAAIPPGPDRGSRLWSSAIYDPVRDRMLVFGGGIFINGQGMTLYDDVWALGLGATLQWTPVPVAGERPGPRNRCAAIYDPKRDRLIVHGGGDTLSLWSTYGPRSDAWALTLSGTPAWTRLTQGAGGADSYEDHVGIYDPARDAMLLFGGTDSTWYPTTWHHEVRALPLAAPGPPTVLNDGSAGPGGVEHAALDPKLNMVFVQGGIDAIGLSRSTWRWDMSATPEWTEVLKPEVDAHPRFGQAMAWDARRGRTVFFGGRYSYYVFYEHPTTYYDDLWSLELRERPIWTSLAVEGPRPIVRQFATLVPDPVTDCMWLFGGNVTTGIAYRSPGTPHFHGDLWRLDLSGVPMWKAETEGGTGPGPRDGHTAVIDPRRHRMLVFGGRDSLGMKNDLWALSLDDPPRWTPLFPSGPRPRWRAFHAAGYDPVGDRLLVYGGVDPAGQSLDDLWQLPLSAPLAWSRLATQGPAPATLGARPAYFDSGRRRLIVIGTGSTAWSPGPTPISVLSLDHPVPRWSLIPATGLVGADVNGRTAVWDESAQRIVALWGTQGFWSDAVEGVGWQIALTEAPEGTVDAGAPVATMGIALAMPAPNPVRGVLRVHGILPAAGDATLTLLDVAGRRVAVEMLRASAPGPFAGTLSVRGLPAGLYFLRLAQGPVSAAARIVVAR